MDGTCICVCGHVGNAAGDGPDMRGRKPLQHAGPIGHGACEVGGCACEKFTWASTLPAPTVRDGVIDPVALAERARLWAERAIEGVDLSGIDPKDAGDAECARNGCESCVKKMEAITHAMASAFVVGYAAALDDQLPRRALVDRQRSPRAERVERAARKRR